MNVQRMELGFDYHPKPLFMKYIISVLIFAYFNVMAFAMSGLEQSNSSKTSSSIENIRLNTQSAAIGKISNQRFLKHLKKRNLGDNGGKDKRVLLFTLGLISLTLVSWALGFQLLSIAGLVFFTFATGIGYMISSKNQGEKKNRFPKAMFIVAIVVNFLGAAIGYVFALFVFD